MASINNQYPWLRVSRPGVDWQHVSPVLLRQLNAIGRDLHKIIVIFSGYRTDAYSAAHGGFAGDPHTQHIAVDATIGGKPIGQVVPARLFKKYGLRSGNQPNFYQGKPDPSHVDLVGTANQSAALVTPDSAPAATESAAGTPVAMPDYSQNTPVGAAPAQGAQFFEPGSIPASDFVPRRYAEMWQQLATQPGATPETLDYAKLASG